MTKNTKYLLFVFIGIIVLVVAIFVFSKGMRENFSATMGILFHKYENYPPSAQYRGDGVSAKPSAPTTVQDGNGSTTNQPVQKNNNTSGSGADVVTSTSHGVFFGPASYRNNEFGFEFTIPDGWQVIENPHASPYSYFNLILEPLEEKAAYPNPILVNIVKPEFVGMSYRGVEPDDNPVTVGGVKGVKYEYPFEGGNITDIILPRSQYTFIIGAWNQYKDTFNEVISSFKFLK
jgi:hypothetical protein